MKNTLTILLLSLIFTISNAQNKEIEGKLKKIKGEWSLDKKTGNVTYLRSIKVSNKTKEDLFEIAKEYIPNFYEDVKMLYKDNKWTVLKKDSAEGVIIIEGRSGTVYSVYNASKGNLFTQDIFHIITINIYDNNVRIKLEQTTFRKIIGLRNPTSEDFELKDLYPVNQQGEEKDFYGNSFYNLHKRTVHLIRNFELKIKGKKTKKRK